MSQMAPQATNIIRIMAVLVGLASGPLLAQTARVNDGTSNTAKLSEIVPARPAVQPADGSVRFISDSLTSGGVNSLTTRGSLTGNVQQTQDSGAGTQSVSVAGAQGNVTANTATLRGGVASDVTQSNTGANVDQRLGVGSLVGSNVGRVETQGDISGAHGWA